MPYLQRKSGLNRIWRQQKRSCLKVKKKKNKTKALLCYDISSNTEAELLSQPVKGRPRKLEEEETYETRKPQETGKENESWD